MTKYVLVAEDDNAIRGLLVGMLNGNGIECLDAADGEEAMKIFDADTESQIFFAILDRVMPMQDGVATYHGIRATHKTLPIAMISGNLNGIYFDDPYLTLLEKPFSMVKLAAMVAKHA